MVVVEGKEGSMGSEAGMKISLALVSNPPYLFLFSFPHLGGADRMEMVKISLGIYGPGEVME